MTVPVRVLFVDQYPTVGGGQRILLGLVEQALAEGWVVGVALPRGGDLETRVGELGATVYGIDVPPMSKGTKTVTDAARYAHGVWSGSRRLRRVVADLKPEVIHVNGGRVLLQSLAAGSGTPMVFHLHSAYDDVPTRRLVGWALASTRVRAAMAPSRFMVEWAASALGLDSRRVRVVRNWVDDAFFTDMGPPQVADPGGRVGNNFVIGVSGRVTREKGQALAVQAARILSSEGRLVSLLIVGPVDSGHAGIYWEEVLREAAALGSDFRFHGAAVDVASLVAGFSVCLVPSVVDESFGLTAAEAMAVGVPVVVSPRGALPEVVGAAGIVADDCTAESFARGIKRLIDDPELRAKCSREGRLRVRRLYSRARQTEEALSVLAEVARHGA